ncbi:hypothetical protein [Afifella marina]|uniref:Uncharacterized protein n=1 Tax=Afifella marina DSM 2698 TaxID=1120955 RepID=A0A1G5MGH9_AFIMA|nr:hypothetical protein [Afifella marina]MBK1625229.1 hypothetical protein [Afifella marina DSM 2698]MBK1628946.1 hypothetical protein [Afifella marina]MBK5918325.1 hypothetical protein [Afifella marina]RAI22842.1 hypothetical protein CH311_04105 [Afifella marina DSM 2698]SCZ23741.1 hypothetical protein SAMN03080610_00596 [Afifella marina DSM 2698]
MAISDFSSNLTQDMRDEIGELADELARLSAIAREYNLHFLVYLIEVARYEALLIEALGERTGVAA